MKKLDLTQTKNKPSPILKGLPTRLKDIECYEVVEKRLINVIRSDHNHKTASAYVKCKECNEKREERSKLIKEIGFKNIQQYMEWKKIMNIIKDKKNFQVR